MILVKTYSRLRCFTRSFGEGWGEVAIIMTDKQHLAHDLYFSTDKTQQEIADILDVSRKTINGWIRKNRWDEMKIAAKQMPSLILQDIYSHINAVNDKIFSRDEAERCPTVKEVNMLHKLLIMTRSIQKQHTGSYIEAFQELQLFIFNRDSDLAMQLREHIADYARGTLGDKEFMARKKRKNNVLDFAATLAKQEMRDLGVPHFQSVATPSAQHEDTQHDPLAVQTRCSASPLAPDSRTLNQGGPSNHANPGQECNPDVTFCNNPVDTTPHDQLTAQTRSTASPLPQDVTKEGQECNPNVTFCNPGEQPATPPVHPPKVFTVAANGEITPQQNSGKGYTNSNSENAAFPVTEGCHPACPPTRQELAEGAILFEKTMALPPNMRPSPFIIGDTVWILHPDHLESHYDTYGNKWGPMKMSYTIRYYPDVDPAKAA